MADSKAYYIVTVGGGKCLDNTESVHGVLDCIPKESESQKWFIETDDKDENVVAFKSAVDGKYLRNNEPAKINWGRIGMGEKQWWTLEKGKNPGSCLIRSNECTTGASYLNDFEGVYRDRNYVHMWQMVKERQFWLDWYIVATDATFNPNEGGPTQSSNGASDVEEGAKAKELDARKAALDKRERNLAKQEAALQERTGDDSAGTKESDSSQSPSQLELLRAENDNLKLQLKIQELEEKLRKASAKANGGKASSKTAPSYAHTNGASKKEDVSYEEGYVAYPPPRKLRRNVIGMVYEGLNQPYDLSTRQKATIARHR